MLSVRRTANSHRLDRRMSAERTAKGEDSKPVAFAAGRRPCESSESRNAGPCFHSLPRAHYKPPYSRKSEQPGCGNGDCGDCPQTFARHARQDNRRNQRIKHSPAESQADGVPQVDFRQRPVQFGGKCDRTCACASAHADCNRRNNHKDTHHWPLSHRLPSPNSVLDWRDPVRASAAHGARGLTGRTLVRCACLSD